VGGVANCVHGFPQSECLICQTLGGSSTKSTATKTKPASPAEPFSALPNGRTSPTLAKREPEPEAQRSGRGMSTFWAILVAIVVGGLLVWAFAGVVSVAFHIAEYVALALVAGWVGYKLGHARGRRGH
jgi:Flp pilus assembly protein TadB